MAELGRTGRGNDRARHADGFTLVEMLVALSILTVGITTLLLALGDSMSLRRSTDARLVAAQAVHDVIHRIENEGIRQRADAVTDLDLELDLPAPITVEGYPGMTISATMEEDPLLPTVWLLRVRASWLERGETVYEDFLRVLPRQLPLGARVRRFREEIRSTTR